MSKSEQDIFFGVFKTWNSTSSILFTDGNETLVSWLIYCCGASQALASEGLWFLANFDYVCAICRRIRPGKYLKTKHTCEDIPPVGPQYQNMIFIQRSTTWFRDYSHLAEFATDQESGWICGLNPTLPALLLIVPPECVDRVGAWSLLPRPWHLILWAAGGIWRAPGTETCLWALLWCSRGTSISIYLCFFRTIQGLPLTLFWGIPPGGTLETMWSWSSTWSQLCALKAL